MLRHAEMLRLAHRELRAGERADRRRGRCASPKSLPAKRRRSLVRVSSAITAAMFALSRISTASTWWLRNSAMFFSARTSASFLASPNSSYVPGEAFA